MAKVNLSERDIREDAGTSVSDEQMRAATPRYPVDRYLVESSKKFELVNIIEDEIWNPEPTLRPEDEIVLRKLHEMLQSTADDLKLLSGELSKYHQPGVQIKTQPTPLDEEFNEKVHIEEVVNAKFHGYKIIDKPATPTPTYKDKNIDKLQTVVNNLRKPKVNASVQVNSAPVNKKPIINRNLEITGTKIIQIESSDVAKGSKPINDKNVHNKPKVVEFSFKYVEPKPNVTLHKNLQVQDMPSINIRSELTEQKVLQIDIIPETKDKIENSTSKSNVAVITVEHETETFFKPVAKSVPPVTTYQPKQISLPTQIKKQPVRKISRMSTCESSGSTTNVSSDTKQKKKTQKLINTVIRTSPKLSARDRSKNKKTTISNKEGGKRSHLNLDEWKKKLNQVYGHPSTSKSNKIPSKTNLRKTSPKKSNLPTSSQPKTKLLNNAEYIPYSKLTLGGARVSDIEKEISNIPNKNDIPLSPILDKIMSSRENSFRNDSAKENKKKDSPRILTTSDENLLQEVIDIERTVSETIAKNLKPKEGEDSQISQKDSSEISGANENDSYAEDFEDEKSDNTQHSEKKNKSSAASGCKDSSSDDNSDNGGSDSDNRDKLKSPKSSKNIQNRTFTKSSSLSIKNSVEVHEYVHSVDRQDSATQSNTTHKISLKETQTSPTNDWQNIRPIHNDLWPSMDPKSEVEKMFKLEKDFIKKLIIDEYGDLLEKTITKPSTSKEIKEESNRNVNAFQKNTQTSPAHVKSVMTSPTRTKTRTTSPFLSVTVEQQTSPMIVVTNEEKLKVEIEDDEDGISINLSSPRFSLRLPQTSREVLSNLEGCSLTPDRIKKDNKNTQIKPKANKDKPKTRKSTVSSSSSVDGENSSSEISSLGEVNFNLKRRIRKSRVPINSESSTSSTVSRYSSDTALGGILPLRSEGEVSLGQIRKAKTNKSEGETSLGQVFK